MNPSLRRASLALSASALAWAGASTARADLIISEYVEGSSTNKAVELYNADSADVDLTGYRLQVYFNGSTTAQGNFGLSGTVEAGGTFVFADALLASYADVTTDASLWNGDDAIVLTRDGAIVDSLGQVGTDPGSQWGTNLTSTADNTLRRRSNVCAGDTDPTDAFDPSAQWEGFAQNTFGGLGVHEANCGGSEPDGGVGDADAGDAGGTDPEPTLCEAPVIAIGAVQGSGAASPRQGELVSVRGIVVGDFQLGGFSGFYLQDTGDSNAATSDGLFIYAPGASAVSLGDLVSVTGTVSEYFGMTEVNASSLEVCASGQPLPAPSALTLPRDEAVFEAHEGMRVSFPQPLSINEYYNFGRYGEIVLGSERHHQPTALYAPGSAEAVALAAANSADRITLDDGRSNQNPDPARHPNGAAFGLDNRFRGGDLVSDLVGVLDYRFDLWRVQPTQNAHVTARNPRPALPDVGGTLRVSSFNVLNYFTTLGSRGAETTQEFERQEAKIVDALATIDADVFGLIEIENNGTALTTLVAALNARLGGDVYAAIETGPLGTDEITTALVYKPATVQPVGSFAALTSAVDPDFDTMKNRPALAQTFVDLATSAKFTVVVNHLKSKGSSCDDVGDPEDPFGQGNCNGVRTVAAEALARWMASDPTGQAPDRSLLIGDFNAYDHEDPVVALEAAGFTDLEKQYGGEAAYSYVFDGQLGYLDYAFASAGILGEVTGAASWHINSDEPSLLDYDMTFKAAAQDAIYAPDAFRSSDHDPVIIGLALVPPLPAWSASQVYTAGAMVSFEGSSWLASWWTQNQRPGNPNGPWQEIVVTPDGRSVWTPSRIFVAGDVVLYQGQTYVAKWWARNQAPGNPWGPWASH